MTLQRSAADVLNEHVVFEVECIDGMYLSLYPARRTHAGPRRTRVGVSHRAAPCHEGKSYLWIVKTTGIMNQWYFNCVDEDFGPFFCSSPRTSPTGDRVYRAGHGFAALDNLLDLPRLQAICDQLGPEQIDALARKWLALLPHPFTPADRAAGYRYDFSILQAEFSLTQVLDKPVSWRMFFEQVIRDNLDIGRPDQVGLIFGRQISAWRGKPASASVPGGPCVSDPSRTLRLRAL